MCLKNTYLHPQHLPNVLQNAQTLQFSACTQTVQFAVSVLFVLPLRACSPSSSEIAVLYLRPDTSTGPEPGMEGTRWGAPQA